MANENEKAQKLTEKVNQLNDFSVDWASRFVIQEGNRLKVCFKLEGSVFKVKRECTPAEFFGQDIKNEGIEAALNKAESGGSIQPHDFGACSVRPGSLRQEANGRWYVDLAPDPTKCRHPKVMTKELDENGEPRLDDNGKMVVKVVPRKESRITCELSWIEPLTNHPLSEVYAETDSHTMNMLRVNEHSKSVTEMKERAPGAGIKKGRSKGKRARLSPAEIAAYTAAQAGA